MKPCEILGCIFAGIFLLWGCADTPTPPFVVNTQSSLNANSARELAKHEIYKRGLPLPSN